MALYNWQQADWPHFRYDLSALYPLLLRITQQSGQLTGKLAHLDETLQAETLLDVMVEEAVKTAAIEGEYVNRLDVRSSLKNRLNPSAILPVHDVRAKGLADLMLDVQHTFKDALTAETLCKWHALLLAHVSAQKLTIGAWRTHLDAMLIVSGMYGKMKIHFEAPPSAKVPAEMARFIHWFNATAPNQPQAIPFAPVRAAIAHLYFESIHPFEDGNGRIGRAIAEKALAQGLGFPTLFSLSKAIEAKKKKYYTALHIASQSNEVTAWITYFVDIILAAQAERDGLITFILKKSHYLDKFASLFNARQLKVVRRMLKEGPKGFDGGMSAKKYMAITGVSKATATRDLQHLQSIHAVQPIGHGRSQQYRLAL